MKKKYLIFIFVIVGICLFPLSSLKAQVIGIQWNTFLGSGSVDIGYGIALDSSGNIYVNGSSSATWGSPINAHSGDYDAFVACMDSSGNLLWNTFLGSANIDRGFGIALYSSGNIYVTGLSWATWGSPINAHSGGADAFVACLDSSGNLLWNTFLGSASYDSSWGIALDSSGNIYVLGTCYATWGSPVNAHSGDYDGFVAKLNSNGTLSWNTFLGSANYDDGYGIALNSSGNIYVTGQSDATWGSPVSAYSGNSDAFVACLDSSGNLLWNTFLGSTSEDYGLGIALDSSGNIYVNGGSDATWGSPMNAYSGDYDGFVACVDSNGDLLWNTFLGSASTEYGYGIALDSSGNIYVNGSSSATWGSPINAHSGDYDAFVAGMDSSGNLLWNSFLGSASHDEGMAIALDSSGNIYVTGFSEASWGTPVHAHSGGNDAFVAELSTLPISNITANGSDGPLSITQADTLQIKVSLVTYGSTDNADFWLAYKTSSGWFHYNKVTKSWDPGLGVTHQGGLFDLNNKKVFQSSGLSPGTYRFYFGVDLIMDGNLTKSELYYDEVKVTVTQ
jgi:formylmethanofuran dehydrogenase subunit C